jgi:Periplasmic binding protein
VGSGLDGPGPERGEGASAPRPWPRVGAVRRLGPALLVVGALVVAGVVATTQSGGSGAPAGSAGPTSAPVPVAAGTSVPVTYQMAEKAGRAADYHWPAGCDRTTGRLSVPTVFAPPCVPVFNGTNGGATASGVTGSTITVVYYVAPPGDLAAQFAGAAGDPTTNLATAEAYVAMLNHIVTLYGRHVQLVPYNATGSSTDAVAARADGIRVAQQIHAFASINGPGQTTAYQDELARQHVLCLSCGVGAAYSELQQDAPYVWALLPTSDTVLTESFRYVITQLMNRRAVYAGDPRFRARKRAFALVHYDQNPPVYSSTTARLDREFASSHLTFALNESYLLDLSSLPTEAATIAEHLKSSGATTVVFAGDPIMPIYLTKACAAIGYYPEWVITGTVFTYTSTLGRLYDQKEWSHAFGISVLAVPTPIQTGDAYRLYDWYYGGTPAATRTAVVILPPILELFDGLELAGPRLTGLTFAEGTFRYPPTGGGPTTPEISFGYRGAPPLPSYTSPSDYTLVWYDASAKGEDEEGVDGTGLMRFVDGGRRYRASVAPATEVPMFQAAGSVTMFASVPPVDRPPSYPPWPGSPRASG